MGYIVYKCRHSAFQSKSLCDISCISYLLLTCIVVCGILPAYTCYIVYTRFL